MPYKDPIKASEKSNERWKSWAKRNPEKANSRMREWRHRNPKYMLYHSAKRRAKERDLDFSITIEDIPEIPEVCPIAQIRIHFRDDGKRGPIENSPTLDRIDPSKGYTRDNIRVISHKGNRLKSDMGKEDLLRILQYMNGSI